MALDVGGASELTHFVAATPSLPREHAKRGGRANPDRTAPRCNGVVDGDGAPAYRRAVRTASLLLLVLLLSSGCRGSPWAASGAVVTGPHRELSPATFPRVVQAARAMGYGPTHIDPRGGTFRVRSRRATPYGERTTFVVRAYREGWLQVIPTGPGLRRRDGSVFAYRWVEQEVGTLAAALARAFEPEHEP